MWVLWPEPVRRAFNCSAQPSGCCPLDVIFHDPGVCLCQHRVKVDWRERYNRQQHDRARDNGRRFNCLCFGFACWHDDQRLVRLVMHT